MLKIYYGRESIDKEGFMFGEIRKRMADPDRAFKERIVILVPDQYTLQAERNALENLEAPGLMDLEILSPGRLAMRVLSEVGGIARVRIDKRGRHMILRGILEEEKDQLIAFRGLEGSHVFIEMVNNLISELKQYDTFPQNLISAVADLKDDPILEGKLKDIHHIFNRYQEKTKNVYLDSEDYLDLFTSKIKESSIIGDTIFWISGFFSFTPKVKKMIGQLMMHSRGVNVVLTGDPTYNSSDLFYTTKKVKQDLHEIAKEFGVYSQDCNITFPLWNPQKSGAIVHIEKELYTFPSQVHLGEEGIKLCKAANFYGEVETAAAEIISLVRDKEMRFRNIAVICNDMETRGPIAKRIFEEYGIPIFTDVKRGILHNPVVALIVSLMDVVESDWLYEDIFTLLKTGLIPIERNHWEELENYAVRYRIQGNKWKRDFKYGISQKEDADTGDLNGTRIALVNILEPFEFKFKKAKTVREKTEILYHYLRDTLEIPEKVEKNQLRMEEKGEHELAGEMGQVWDITIDLFDQLVELSGEQEISIKDFSAMVRTGFETVEVGVIPPSSDQVVMGTMQRTRVGRIKAMFVLAANDGILPADIGQNLFNDDERKRLLGINKSICEDDKQMAREEQIAIYKNLSAPEELLWMGYSIEDIEGEEMRPSVVFDMIKKMFPNIPVENDVQNREDPMWLINSDEDTIKHLTAALQKDIKGEKPLGDHWMAASNWYRNKSSKPFMMMKKGLFFRNSEERLSKELSKNLFGKAYSPSRLEKFSRCPFSHFILYGLRPDERRVFEVSGREVGDVYHECIMVLSEQLTKDCIEVNHVDSLWMTITKEECYSKVSNIIDDIAWKYKDGMLLSGEEEIYRMGRMKDVCSEAAWALITHVRQGSISEMFFEESFGDDPGKRFPPISVDVGGDIVRIEGKIDRVDILSEGYVKIIDYKSGREDFQIGEARGGWRLQLMIYLKAMMQGIGGDEPGIKPAGVFYFEIADPLIDAGDMPQNSIMGKVENELRKSFKLNGILLDEPHVIKGIAGEFSGNSEILPIRKNKDGGISGTGKGRLLSEEQFNKLCDEVDEIIQRLCVSLYEGRVDVHPKKIKYESACTYCQFKSICTFDISFEGCSYDIVKEEI